MSTGNLVENLDGQLCPAVDARKGRPLAMDWTCQPCGGAEGCPCHKQSSGLEQSLAELEFMRSASSAAQVGDVRRLEQLVTDAPHRLAACDSTGYTPLHYAARGGHSECVGLLLRHRACVDARTSGGATALHRAAFTGQTSVCMLLLRAKASVTTQDSDGETPLHKAAAQQQEATVQLLFNVRHPSPVQFARGLLLAPPLTLASPEIFAMPR